MRPKEAIIVLPCDLDRIISLLLVELLFLEGPYLYLVSSGNKNKCRETVAQQPVEMNGLMVS